MQMRLISVDTTELVILRDVTKHLLLQRVKQVKGQKTG